MVYTWNFDHSKKIPATHVLGSLSRRVQIMKEFALLGANSFLENWTPFEEMHVPEKKTGIQVVPWQL